MNAPLSFQYASYPVTTTVAGSATNERGHGHRHTTVLHYTTLISCIASQGVASYTDNVAHIDKAWQLETNPQSLGEGLCGKCKREETGVGHCVRTGLVAAADSVSSHAAKCPPQSP